MSGLTATPKRRAGAAFAVLALLASLMIGFANPASAASTVTPKGLSIGGTIYGSYDGDNISPSAGLIGVDTDGNGSVDAYAYCIDLGHPLANNQTYTEGSWNSSNVPNLGKITWILQNYDPSNAANRSETTAKAVQAAIWHFSDGFNLSIDGTNSGNSKAVEELYSYILANAQDVPEPHPTLSITPADQSGEIQTGLVYDVTSTAPGPVALAVAGGPAGTKILPVKGDGTCDTAAVPISSLPLVGGAAKVCLYSDQPGGAATLTGTVTEATASGRVFLYAPSPNSKQKLIFAGGGTVSASATAKGSWVSTPEPVVSGKVECSAQGGTITVTLANEGNGTVAFDVYQPNTNTLDVTVTVGAKDSKTVSFGGLADGTYGVKVIAKYDGKNVDKSLSNLVVDCQPKPVATAKVECADNDGTIVVTLKNEGPGEITYKVTNPVTQQVTTETVGAKGMKTVSFTGIPDGTYDVPVIAQVAGKPDQDLTIQDLVVDCDAPGTPVVEKSVVCASNDGTVTLTLKNTGTPGKAKAIDFVAYEADGTTVKWSGAVQPGQQHVVTYDSVADGTWTYKVTADGEDMSQTVTVDCDGPGTPVVTRAVECSSNDGVVTLTLENTGAPGKAKAVHYVVYDRDGTTVVWEGDVAAGGQHVQTFNGVPDGTWTYKVTADGQDMSQTVTVDCDGPGTPVVTKAVECSSNDGVVTLTLENTGAPGKAKAVHYVVYDRDGTTVVWEGDVAAGGQHVQTFSGVPDGTWTYKVTADGQDMSQTVTVDCDGPGTPVVESSVACADNDGTVTLALENTGTPGKAKAVHYVVYDRDGTTVAWEGDVLAGGSKIVTFDDVPDGTWTYKVTADGEDMSQTVTVACDAPGIPVVSSSVECTVDGGQITVTLTNDGTEGKNLPVTFTVTDPRDDSTQDVTVEPGQSKDVVLEGFADGTWTISVSAGEEDLDQTVDVRCSQPVVEGITLECGEGGMVVGLGNEGTNPTTMVVSKDGTVVTTVEVPAGATVEVLVPMVEDEKATITVTAGGEVIAEQTVTLDCQNPTTTTTAAPSSTVEVAGVTQTPVTPRGALPYTGGEVLRTVLLGLGLAAAGFGLVMVTRRRRS